MHDLILLLLIFLVENICSQIYVELNKQNILAAHLQTFGESSFNKTYFYSDTVLLGFFQRCQFNS